MSYEIVELRRYTFLDGEVPNFARYFETIFPDVFLQLGCLVLGAFYVRGRPNEFLWFRGFPTYERRAEINTQIYDGPVWETYKPMVNTLIVDSDNVLLLRAVREMPVMPAVDFLKETPQGIVVAQIFNGVVDRPPHKTLRDGGLLVSVTEPNNFPRHPIRTDGPHTVWVGIARDEEMLAEWKREAEKEDAEIVVLEPAPRSRMRWIE